MQVHRFVLPVAKSATVRDLCKVVESRVRAKMDCKSQGRKESLGSESSGATEASIEAHVSAARDVKCKSVFMLGLSESDAVLEELYIGEGKQESLKQWF